MHASACRDSGGGIQHDSFRPVQASAFSDKLLLHREKAYRPATVTFRPEYTIRDVVHAMAALIKRQSRLNLHTIR